MIGRTIKIVLALTRLDTCALVFVSVFAPTYYYSHNFYFSFSNSFPILAICMCGFVINDLSDIEKDKENHPHRPLPSNTISEVVASVVYFALLAISLVTIKLYVSSSNIYLYVLLLIALINYNYVVAYVPLAKNIYVAMVGVIPILILSSLVQNTRTVSFVAPSLFLFLLGRELLMDVQDSKGDIDTLANKIGSSNSEKLGFGLKFLSTLGLCFLIRGISDAAVSLVVLLLDIVFIVLWRRHRYRRVVIHMMKIQLLVGIYYLITQVDS